MARQARQTMSRENYYNVIKEKIARESKTPEEYERRVRALARRLGL